MRDAITSPLAFRTPFRKVRGGTSGAPVVTTLRREADGSVTVLSLAPPPAIYLTRELDGSVTVRSST